MTEISIRQAIEVSWQSAKRDWRVWLVVAIIFTIGALPQQVIDINHAGKVSIQSLPWIFANIVLLAIFSPGIQQNGLLAARGQLPTIPTLTEKISLAGKFFLFFLLYVLIVGLGFVLLIIPGIYLLARYSMVPYILLDNPTISVTEAMSQSSILTKGKILRLIAAIFVLTLIAGLISSVFGFFLGFLIGSLLTAANVVIYNILLVIPATISMPFNMVGGASVYEQIKQQSLVQE